MENNTRNQRWYLAESVKTGANSIAADDYQKVTELNNLEINNELLNNMNGREMPAYSPMLEIGVEYETIDTMDVEKYEYNNGFTIKEVHTFIDKISNMDFGIVEKPHAVVQAIKRVENIIYQNAKGNTLFYGDPTKDAKIQYVKTYYVNDADKSNGKVEAEIDSDLIQGATLNVIYALKIRNESETDYNTKDYYYYGTKGTEAQKSKINITKVADYMTKDLVFDEQSTNQKNTGAWIKKDLDNNFKKLIDTSIVKTDGYQILMSETYGEIKQNDTAEKYLYATVRTSTSSNTEFINGMEILGYKGGKRIQNTTPGNYNPNNIVNTQNVNPEKDSSFMITVISAPTGKDINYTPYIVIAIVTLTMVAVAIVIIKRKITK
ncbi:MAG: hypothetical protein IJV31_09290 [Clostridia bacterium]|nr:hypothetical protein [Clostridia bacterium]